MPVRPLNETTEPLEPAAPPGRTRLSQTQAVAEIERTVGGSISTDVHLNLASLGLDTPDLRRASRQAARLYDVSPRLLLGGTKISDLKDPITGGPLRPSQFRRMIEGIEPLVLGQMIQTVAAQDEPHADIPGRRKFGSAPARQVNADHVAAFLSAIGPMLKDNDEVTASDAISTAYTLARNPKLNAKMLGENLRAVKAWGENNGVTDHRQLLTIATAAAEGKVRLTSISDVVRFTNPGLASVAAVGMEQLRAEGFDDEEVAKAYEWMNYKTTELLAGRIPDRPDREVANTVNSLLALAPAEVAIHYWAKAGSRDIHDYFADAEAINDQLIAQEMMWENSWVNKYIATWALKGLEKLNRGFEIAAVSYKFGFESAGPTSPLSAGAWAIRAKQVFDDKRDVGDLGVFGLTPEAGQALFSQYTEDVKAAWHGKLRLADTMVRDWGTSRLEAEATEFLLGWALDPLIVGGKIARAVAMRKVNPSALTRAGQLASASQVETYAGRAEKFVASEGGKLAKALRTSDEAVIEWSRNYRTVMGETAFDTPLLLKARKEIVRRGVTREAVRSEADELLRGPLLGGAAPGSVADLTYASRIAETQAARERVFSTFASSEGRDNWLRYQEARARLNAVELEDVMPRRLEIPKKNLPVPGFGLKGWTAAHYESFLGDSLIGRELAKLPNIDPGAVIKVHKDPQLWFKRAARRAGLPDTEVLQWEARAAGTIGSAAPERNLKTLLDEFHNKVWRGITETAGLSEQASGEMLKDFLAHTGKHVESSRVFGAYNDIRYAADGTPYYPKDLIPAGEAKPLAPTQLVNELPTLDPVLMQRYVHETVGYIKRLRAGFYRGEGAKFGTTAAATAKVPLAKWVDALARPVGRTLLKTFKFTHVARPAYIFRVVLGDELMRGLATTQSAFEWTLAYGWHSAALANIPTPPLVRAFLPEVTALKSAAQRFGPGFDARLARAGERTVGDIVVPGPSSVPYEPLANTSMSARDLLADNLRSLKRRTAALDASGDWVALAPDKAGHIDAWRNALNLQIGKAPVGFEALQAIADGRAVTQAGLAEVLERYARGKGSKELRRIGRANQAADWSEKWAHIVWTYTSGGDANLARLAMFGEVDNAVLDAIPLRVWTDRGKLSLTKIPGGEERFGRPFVNGPRIKSLAQRARGDSWQDRWYGLWVRGPENILNRQTYYRVFRQRSEAAYIQMYLRQGGVPTTQLDEIQKVIERRVATGGKTVQPMVVSAQPTDWASQTFDRYHATVDIDTVRRYVPANPDGIHVFHGTSLENLTSIRKNGLLASRGKVRRGEAQGVYFAESANDLFLLRPGVRRTDDVFLRVDRTKVPLGKTDMYPPESEFAEWLSTVDVPPAAIEMLAADGSWRPLNQIVHGARTERETITVSVATKREVSRVLTPEARAIISERARKFSLANSKKIMFDFTEDSRLGEMLSFVFPFMQPWAENFAVWGHILSQRNPAVFGYVNRLAQAGIASGFIRRDPDTGEYVIPETWWLFSAPLLWAVGGADTKGKWSVTTPVTSLNLFASNTLEVMGVPLPAPGMAPWGQFGLSKLLQDEENVPGWAHNYIFAFGPGATDIPDLALQALLPRAAVTLLRAVPGSDKLLGDDQLQSIAQEMQRMQQALGQEPDPDRALSQARGMMGYLAYTQLFFPGSVRVEYPHSWLTRLYHEKADELGGGAEGYQRSREWMEKHYPEYDLITIPKTIQMKMANFIDSSGGRFLQAFGYTAVAPDTPRAPSSRLFDELIKHPGFKEFANDPETSMWAAGLVAGFSGPATEFDYNVYFSQFARGDTRTRSVHEAYEIHQAGQFFDAWQPVDHFYEREEARLRATGLDDNDPKIIELKLDRALDLEEKALEFDIPVGTYVTPRKGGGYQFAYETGEQWPEGVHPQILESAYIVAKAPLTQGFPAFDGLRSYIELREETKKALRAKGYDGLEATGAQGIKGRYEQALKPLLEANPEFRDSFYGLWFENDLTYGVVSKVQEKINSWRTSDDEALNAKYERYVNFSTTVDGFATDRTRIRAEGTAAELSASYTAETVFLNANPQFADLLYQSLSPSQKEIEKRSTTLRPVAFWSNLDWRLMTGEKISKRASGWLEEYQQRSSAIQAWSEETDYVQSSGERRTKLNDWVKSKVGKDPDFDRAVEAMNVWGYGAIAAGFTKGEDKAARAWSGIISYANDWRERSLAGPGSDDDLHGDQYGIEFDRNNIAWWNNARDNVRNYYAVLAEWSPKFEKQWGQLSAGKTDSLHEWLVPHVYFKVG